MYERDDGLSEKSNISGDHASWPYIECVPFHYQKCHYVSNNY